MVAAELTPATAAHWPRAAWRWALLPMELAPSTVPYQQHAGEDQHRRRLFSARWAYISGQEHHCSMPRACHSGTDGSLLLNSLRDYRSGSATQQQAGLSHLMTGRDLDGQTVALPSSATPARGQWHCPGSSRFSASFRSARFVSYDALIAAHEMGRFGAPHDGETDPTPTRPAPPYLTTLPLMAGTISNSPRSPAAAWRRWHWA
jgi:hypothetical protein